MSGPIECNIYLHDDAVVVVWDTGHTARGSRVEIHGPSEVRRCRINDAVYIWTQSPVTVVPLARAQSVHLTA